MADREVRIALVMNGGVSLAVWMAGVSHEIDLIRRASAGKPPQLKPHDSETGQRWRDLLRPADQPARRLVVDVVAGTSAGGLNGTMLATAVAHGGSLDPEDATAADCRGPWLREKWCELGALEIGKLLPRDPMSASSLLDSEFFTSQVDKLIRTLAVAGDKAGGDEPDDPSGRRVTLFTPASGLGVQNRLATDAAGATFNVPDHRFLYRFTTDHGPVYQGDGSTFLDPSGPDEFANTAALAHAARASASFPAAFEPISEEEVLNGKPPRVLPADTQDASWLADGGILDNAPFGPVLDTVARTPVDADASRYVLYVVPSSGVSRRTDDGGNTKPGMMTVVRSALSFPTEADFRGDVDELEGLLADGDASWSDTQRLFDAIVEDAPKRADISTAAKALLPTYVRGRVAGALWEAGTLANRGRVTMLTAGPPIGDAEVDALLGSTAWTPDPNAELDALLPSPAEADVWPWGVTPAERVLRLVLRNRRTALAQASDPASDDNRADLRAISVALRNVLSVRDALETRLRASDPREEVHTAQTAQTLNQAYADLRVSEAIANQIRPLLESSHLRIAVEAAIAVEVVSRCTSARSPGQRSAPFTFLRLGPDAALPLLSDANDQEALTDLGDDILYGTQVSHFGAFGAPSWRRWDWMLGRLHAVAHLGALLAEPANAQQWIRDTQEAVLRSEGWTVDDFRRHLDAMRATHCDDKGRAIGVFIDELNAENANVTSVTRRPAQTMEEICTTFIAASGRLGRSGEFVTAALAREAEIDGLLRRSTRWISQPARVILWRRMTSGHVEVSATRAPWFLRRDVSYLLPATGLAGIWVAVATADQPTTAIAVAAVSGVVAALGLVHVAAVEALHLGRRRAGAAMQKQVDQHLGKAPTT